MLCGQYLFHHQREESLERQVFGGGGKPRIPVFGLRHNLKTSGTTSIQASKAPAQLEASKPPAKLGDKPQKLRERLRKTKGGLRRHWDQLQCKTLTFEEGRKGCHAVMMPEYRTKGNRNLEPKKIQPFQT